MTNERKPPAGEVEVFPTQDEAIAAALRDSPDGDEIAIHDQTCKAKPDGTGCTCQPLIARVGPKA